MSDASVSLDLDAKPMYTELATAEQRFAAGMHRIEGQADSAQSRMFASNKRVSRNMTNFLSQLVSGGDPTQMIGQGLMSLDKSFSGKMSIGILAGVGAMALLIEKVSSLVSEYKKFNVELDKASAPRKSDSLAAINRQLDAVKEALGKAPVESKGALSNWLIDTVRQAPQIVGRKAMNMIGAGPILDDHPGDGIPGAADERAAKLEATRAAGNDAIRSLNDHQKRINDIDSSTAPDPVKEFARLQMEWEQKILEAAEKGGAMLAHPLIEASKIAEEKFAEKLSDSHRFSLEELAKTGGNNPTDGSKYAVVDGQRKGPAEAARLALEAKANMEAVLKSGHDHDGTGHTADYYKDRYQEITSKAGIGDMVKGSEMIEATRTALDTCTALKDLRGAVEKIGVRK
jgi:hypothetical protein